MDINRLRLSCVGSLMVLFGLAYGALCLRFWLNPNALNPDSWLYQWIYGSFFSWWRAKDSQPQLTSEEIRSYAIRAIVACIISVIVGFLALAASLKR